MSNPPVFHSGFVSIIGRPNVGKSTLLNHLVQDKIAAISRRPQTTRNKITGICHFDGGQIVLVDTPGIHQSNVRFNKFMVDASLSTYNDVDLILFLIDAKKGFCEEDEFVLETLKKTQTPKILVVNKVDLIPKMEILSLIRVLSKEEDFKEVVPISALRNDGLDLLAKSILGYLPEGPEYFPKGMITDCPEEFIVGELIREKIIKLTHMEIPYSVAVVVDNMEEGKKGVFVIDATLFVEKTSQKKILIGEKGSCLKKVGQYSREEIEKRFGCKVYLKLFVKVKKDWRKEDRFLREVGYINDSH